MYDTETILELDDDAVEAAAELRSVRDAIKALKGREEVLKAILLASMSEADQGVNASGVPVIEVRRQSRSSVDVRKLQALYEDVWKNCQRETVVASLRFPAED